MSVELPSEFIVNSEFDDDIFEFVFLVGDSEVMTL